MPTGMRTDGFIKASKIVLPEQPEWSQLNLFAPTSLTQTKPFDPFPEVLRTQAGFEKVLERATDALGIDFEFNPKTNKPSILGIAVRDLAAAIPWDARLATKVVQWCMKFGIKLVGHSVVGADRPVLEQALGIHTPLEMWEDSMREHYLLHADFNKAAGSKDEDEGSLGFNNLYIMASMTTMLPNWKVCRGRACEGPCPKHQVFEYCAIDAYAGLEGHYVMQEEMKRVGIPYSFYRELMELAEICHLMETQGVRINEPYIEVLDRQMEEAKDAIFEYTENNGKKFYKTFNPKSPDQISSWFASRGENLQSTDIKYIQRKLEKLSDAGEFPELTDYVDFLEQNLEKQNETTQELYKLYKFKTAGKGTDAWFNAKYRKRDFIHPRFVDTGTSSGRLSSSKPNFTNIPSRGFASAVDAEGVPFNRIKKAIIPRDESLDFIEADAAQLELRGCLYLSGVDPSDAGADAFTWLVQQNPEGFRKAAELWPGLDPTDPKDVRYTAKSMSHAADYLEGIEIYTPSELSKPHIKKLISAGAIRLYPKWEYCGGIVGFTGSNLAQRFFGSRSEANRIRALQIQEDVYFKTFPMIRVWQQKVLAEIESKGCINTPTGRYLRLYGSPRDNAKAGVATLGQGLGADHIEAIMIQYYRKEKFLFDLMVHDSLLAGIPKNWTDRQARDFIQPMAEESGLRLSEFKAPIDIKRGPNYGCMRKLKI